MNHHRAVQGLQEGVKYSRASNINEEWGLTILTFGILKCHDCHCCASYCQSCTAWFWLIRTNETCSHWSSIIKICGVRWIVTGFWILINFNVISSLGKILQLIFYKTNYWYVTPLFIQAYVRSFRVPVAECGGHLVWAVLSVVPIQ
jgi:hypothetical protein